MHLLQVQTVPIEFHAFQISDDARYPDCMNRFHTYLQSLSQLILEVWSNLVYIVSNLEHTKSDYLV